MGQLRLPVALCRAVLCAPEPVVDVLVVVVPVVVEVDVAALAIAAPPPVTAPMVASVAIRGLSLWDMFVSPPLVVWRTRWTPTVGAP